MDVRDKKTELHAMNSPFILLFDFELDRDSMEPLQFNQFSIQVQFACEYVN